MTDELTAFQLEQIDAICLEFEDHWSGRCISTIESLVSTVQPNLRRQLLKCLLTLEIELCCSQDHTRLLGTTGGSPEILLTHYCGRFDGTMDAELFHELLVAEFKIRQAFDRPETYAVSSQFPELGFEFHRRLRAVVVEANPLNVTVYHDDRRRIQTNLLGIVHLGRQRANEPMPFEVIELPIAEEAKIVIATRKTNTVSRQQLSLEMVACDRVRISNSGKLDLVCDRAQLVVCPQETATIGIEEWVRIPMGWTVEVSPQRY